ncbi:hypothetical protein D3C81_560190 [compost metagenome]
MRRCHQHPPDHFRRAFFLQGADQRLPDPELGQHRQRIKRRVRPETLGYRAQGLLFLGGERTQTVLDAQAQLRQHIVRQVTRRLGNEIHTHAFRTNQPHDLLQTITQCLGRTVEQQVGLVEEQRQQRLVGIATLRQLFEQLGQQPQQERRVDFRRFMHQAAGIQQMNATAPVRRGLEDVFELQRRLAEQGFGALLLQGRQTSQQCLAGAGGHQCRIVAQQLGVVPQVIEQRLQILEIEQQQAFAVRHLERRVQRRLLTVGQFQQAAQQQRPHFTQGCA